MTIKASISEGEPLPGGQEERFTIEVSGVLPPGAVLPAMGAVVARVNSEEVPEIRIPVVIYKPRGNEVRITPERLAFGVLKPGASAKRVVVIAFPNESDYVVGKAEASGEGVSVRVDTSHGAKGARTALLHCLLDASALRGAVKQEVVITMTSPGKQDEIHRVPLSAYVKPPLVEQAAETLPKAGAR